MDQLETTWELFRPPPETQLAWMSRQPSIVGGGLDSLAQMRAFAARYGQDSYFTPNPVRPGFGCRPSTVHVAYVTFVCIDLDPVAEVHPDRLGQLLPVRDGLDKCGENGEDTGRVVRQLRTIEGSVIDHAQSLLGLDLHPDRIDSGRGRQLWLRFEPTAVVSQEQKERWRAAVAGFLHRLDEDLGDIGGHRVDTSVSDLPRLVRLPGTINTKTGRRAEFIEVGRINAGLREALLGRFGLSSPRPGPAPHVLRNGRWEHSAHLLSIRAKRFLFEGVGEPGRHSSAFAAAASMRDMGASYEVTERAVLLGAGKCSPPLGEYEAKRCVRNAFAK